MGCHSFRDTAQKRAVFTIQPNGGAANVVVLLFFTFGVEQMQWSSLTVMYVVVADGLYGCDCG